MATGIHTASVRLTKHLESDEGYMEAASIDLQRMVEKAISEALVDGRTYVVSQRRHEGPHGSRHSGVFGSTWKRDNEQNR